MNLDLDIRSAAAAWPDAAPLLRDAWPPEVLAQLPWGQTVFALPELRVLLEAEDEGFVSHVGLHRRRIAWNGRDMTIGGVGGVVTRSDMRGRGFASIALRAATQTLRDEGAVVFALLFCEEPLMPFYARNGWQAFTGDITAEQPAGNVAFTVLRPMVFDLRFKPRTGKIDLKGLPW